MFLPKPSLKQPKGLKNWNMYCGSSRWNNRRIGRKGHQPSCTPQSPYWYLSLPRSSEPWRNQIRAANGIFIEISAKKVTALPLDISPLQPSKADAIVRGAGLDDAAYHQGLITNPQALTKNLPSTCEDSYKGHHAFSPVKSTANSDCWKTMFFSGLS